jgi:hypothetical protein
MIDLYGFIQALSVSDGMIDLYGFIQALSVSDGMIDARPEGPGSYHATIDSITWPCTSVSRRWMPLL